MTSLNREKNRQSERTKNLFLLAFILFGLLLAALVAWQFASPPLTDSLTPINETGTSLSAWEAQAIESYRFDLTVGCFCLYEMTRPVTIIVENGEAASITYIDDGTAANPEFFQGFATIDQLFERLAAYEAQNPAIFDVVYDEALGIPLSADIDVSEMMADEELSLTVNNFEALP